MNIIERSKWYRKGFMDFAELMEKAINETNGIGAKKKEELLKKVEQIVKERRY